MRRNAFTLVELLVVVAIIALLLGILLPSLNMARNLARQTKAMSACKQLMLGYTMYHGDFSNHVLFGYPPGYVEGRPLSVSVPSGHTFSAATDHAMPIIRYPARIASYEQHAWEILYDHVAPPDRPTSSDSQSDAWSKLYKLSVFPSFGINGTYIGGSTWQHGFNGDRLNRNRHVVFRENEVERPASLIVFGESIQRGGGDDTTTDGYHLLMPPVTDERKWHSDCDGIERDASGLMGIPQGRFNDKAVTAFFDGHVQTMTSKQLDNMTLWMNGATDPDEGYTP